MLTQTTSTGKKAMQHVFYQSITGTLVPGTVPYNCFDLEDEQTSSVPVPVFRNGNLLTHNMYEYLLCTYSTVYCG